MSMWCQLPPRAKYLHCGVDDKHLINANMQLLIEQAANYVKGKKLNSSENRKKTTQEIIWEMWSYS